MKLLWLLCLIVLAGCASGPGPGTPGAIDIDPLEEVVIEQTQIDEKELLDVGIILIDPGEITDEQAQEFGITPAIRKAEARYMSYHLSQTMQNSGAWGSVNVLPVDSEVADISVYGEIVESTGEILELKVLAQDSSGTQWFERHYRAQAEREDYSAAEEMQQEVFQAIYNRIASDIYDYQKVLTAKQLLTIRDTSELRYAANLAPAIYSDYIETSEEGVTTIKRLPAVGDPSIERVRNVREREYLLVNAINEHYGNYYQRVEDPYANWRKFYLIETLQKRDVEREVKTKKAAGAGLILLAVVMAVLGGSVDPIAAGVAGGSLYRDGENAKQEAVIHRAAVIELSQSLQADVEPVVVELDGETTELTGSLDEQYAQWRGLLEKIYAEEVGFPLDDTDDSGSTFAPVIEPVDA